ncbi:MAG: hypothetical protein ACPGTP_03675 [Bacteroidia bacterium]
MKVIDLEEVDGIYVQVGEATQKQPRSRTRPIRVRVPKKPKQNKTAIKQSRKIEKAQLKNISPSVCEDQEPIKDFMEGVSRVMDLMKGIK